MIEAEKLQKEVLQDQKEVVKKLVGKSFFFLHQNFEPTS
jgi:hypothetical protein